MSHRYKNNDGKKGFLIVWILLIALGIPLLIFNVGDTREEVEREIHIEGFITEKNIERGFGSAYIFVINGTTDLQVNRVQYDYFSVGDYIIVYIIFLGYELERRD